MLTRVSPKLVVRDNSRISFQGIVRRLRRARRVGMRASGPVVRRIIDVGCSSIALVLLAPLAFVIAALVKLESRGPVFYSQRRVGLGGRVFVMRKVRTMVANADAQVAQLAASQQALDAGIRFKLKRDPRVTRIGRVLRKLSIDELPQLWNVLVGDMTLVGPRPPLPREVERYDARALRRLSVRPGLTCLWQIEGRSDLSFDQQVQLDLHYIDRVRAWQELGIVVRTIPAVLTGRGAY